MSEALGKVTDKTNPLYAWMRFHELESKGIKPELRRMKRQQRDWKFFDVYDKGPFDLKQHLQMRLELQKPLKAKERVVETSLKRLSEMTYSDISGPKAQQQKAQLKKTADIKNKIRILGGQASTEVLVRKHLSQMSRSKWERNFTVESQET
jgi:hypothetical protein